MEKHPLIKAAKYQKYRACGILCIVLLVFLACFHRVSYRPENVPRIAWPATAYNQLFNRDGDGWTGGDGTLSIPWKDGRTVWLFGDTFLGEVGSDGTRDDAFLKLAYLARATTGSPGGPWAYYTGRGWSADPEDSAPILNGVSTRYSVFQTGGIFYFVTMDGRGPFPDAIAVYKSASASGPWQGPRIIYQVPGVGRDVVAYNPFVHTQFKEGNRYLISYNLNHVNDPLAVFDDATIYRPRFIWVDFAPIERQFSQQLPGK